MASLNKVILIGNLGRDPEMRYLPSGDPVANFSLATTETWKDKSGQKQERTEWHKVEVFGKMAEIVRDYCTKGKQVYLEGSITYQEWTDKEGVKKVTPKIKLSGPRAQLVLLGGGGGRGAGDRGAGPRGGGGGGETESPAGGPPAGGDDFQVSDDDVPF
jgi:single-strand DNA-binding protein